MRVYLTGFMASGKSTVGPQVAARLGQPFLDLDRLITVHAGCSIPALFAKAGEERFRALETRMLRETAETNDLVVALGGGALVDDDNRAFALEHGLVVYLEASVDTILERVADDANERPLLQDDTGAPLSPNEQRTRIEQMLADRRPAYEAAHCIVDANAPVDAVVAAIQDAVAARTAPHPR